MESTPHGLFTKQSKQLSVLAQILSRAVADLPGCKDLCASIHEIQREADALSMSRGIEVQSARWETLTPPLPPQAQNTQRPQSAKARGSDSGESLGTVRVGDFRQDLDALCAQMRRARADLDALGCSGRRQDDVAEQNAAAIKQLRNDLQDMQEAIVTHDNDIQALTDASKIATKKIDMETEMWRATTARDAAELRQMLKGVNEEVDSQIRRLQQALDTGLAEDRKLIHKYSAELQAEISGVSGASCQEMKELMNNCSVEHERRIASADARFSEQLTDGLNRYGEGLRVEIRELRGRVEAELTNCRQEQSLLGERFSSRLEDVSCTSRRAVEEVTEAQKAVLQFEKQLGRVQREVEDARHTHAQATESLRTQLDLRLKENQESQEAASVSGLQNIEYQAETMANIITREVNAVRVEFDATIAHVHAQIDQSNANQFASSQSLAAAQEAFVSELRDSIAVVGQRANEASSRVGVILEEVEGRSIREMEELKSSMASQLAKLDKTTSEAYNATKEQSGIVTKNLREDFEHQLSEVRVSLSDVQRELSSNVRGLEHELASSRKAQDAKVTQVAEDLNDVRQCMECTQSVDVTKAKDAAERVESAARQSATDIAATLRSMREQARTDHESFGVELRGLLAHSEQRLRLGIEAVQSHVDEVQNAARRSQTDVSAELQRLQIGLGEAERTLCTVGFKVDKILPSAESAARDSMPTAGEMKAHENELQLLRNAGDILATGVLRIGQIIGVLPGLEHVDDTRLNCSSLDLTELLRWEQEGNPLVKRMESAWQPRLLAQGGSVLDSLQRKAEQSTLRLVQSALRDLDVRVSHMRTGGGLETLGPPPWLGKPGAVGSHVGEKGVAVEGTEKTKRSAAEAQDWKPHVIPRPPSAPPSRTEEATYARRLAGTSPSAEDRPNIPPPSWA